MDSEGGRLKGARFSVGSGSPYAYGVLDDGCVHSPLSFSHCRPYFNEYLSDIGLKFCVAIKALG